MWVVLDAAPAGLFEGAESIEARIVPGTIRVFAIRIAYPRGEVCEEVASGLVEAIGEPSGRFSGELGGVGVSDVMSWRSRTVDIELQRRTGDEPGRIEVTISGRMR